MGFSTSFECMDVTAALKGKYNPMSVAKYGRERLEKTVTHLVNVTTGHKENNNNHHRPLWWPEEVAFAHSLQELKKLVPDSVWNQMLRRLVLLCRDFYCAKRRKGKKSVLREIHQNNLRPVVYLRDVCRVLEKDRFVRGLGLVRAGGHVASAEQATPPSSVAKPMRLAATSHVPFSSEYGQLLMRREKPQRLEQIHLKRLERIERYLRSNEGGNPAEYPVTYDKRDDAGYCHLFRFPVRQAYQIQDKVEFLRSLCKPVCVVLQRCDVARKRKVLRVVLTRLKLDSVKLRKRTYTKNL